MKTSQRITSIFLALLLLVSSVPFAFAQTEMPVADNSDISLQSSNALGRVLASALNEESEDDGTVAITGLSVNEKTATVSLKTDKEATAVVAIYDESGLQMLASGKQAVAANDEEAVVTIETDTMPEYYTAKAFLLDADYHALCEAYISKDNTRAYEEFMAKTTDDFEQNLVVNFDESEDTNFAVLTDDSVIAETSGDKNVLVNADDDALTYTFSHIDGDIRDLAKGDVFFYESDETAIALKVDSVSISGDTATIQAQEDTEFADVFDFVKIDATAEPDDSVMDTAEFGEGVTYLGSTKNNNAKPAPKHAPKKAEIDTGATTTWKYNFEVNWDHVTAGFELSTAFEFKLYYDIVLFGKDYVEASFAITNTSKWAITFKGAVNFLDLENLYLVYLPEIPLGYGLTASFKVVPALEASASLSASISTYNKIGFTHKTGVGTKPINESSTEKQIEAAGKINIFVGIKPIASVAFLKIARAELSAKAGLEADGTATVPSLQEDDSIQHTCNLCIEGLLNFLVELSASLKIGTEKHYITPVKLTKTFKVKLGNFYLSHHQTAAGTSTFEFAMGTCPYKKYRVTYTIVNEMGNPIQGAYVGDLVTDENGQAHEYLQNGRYGKYVTYGDYGDVEHFFEIHGEAIDVYIDMADPMGGLTIQYEGSCGHDATYTLYTNGLLIIKGTGEATISGVHRAGPYNYWMGVRSVIVQNGITEVSFDSSFGGQGSKSITLAKSVKSFNVNLKAVPGFLEFIVDIENTTFKSEDGVLFSKDGKTLIQYPAGSPRTSYTVPAGVEIISDNAFREATTLQTISFPESILHVGYDAFTDTNCIRGTGEYYIGKVFYKYFAEDSNPMTGVSIKPGTVEIFREAFMSVNLVRIDIPDSLKIIGQHAFLHCSNLSTVTLPNGLESIDYGAFSDSGLKSITIPNGVSYIGSGAFAGCNKMETALLPNNMKEIPQRLFSGCTSLKEIHIPDTVERVHNFAFSNCAGIDNIVFSNRVSYIGDRVIENCTNLKDVYIMNPNCSLYYVETEHKDYYGTTITVYKAICNGTIHGYSGSTAEVYAQEAGLPFVAINAAAPAPARNAPARAAANRTATFDHAVKGEQYVFLAVKDKAADDLLAADNLLYIDQTTAGSSKVSFTYLPKDGVISLETMILGMCSHSFISYPLSEATCSAEGEEMLICEYCGSIEKKPIPMKPHAYTTSVTEATCTEDGQTVYTCPDCGDTYTEPVFATGHAWGDWVIVKPATETEEGLMERVCQNNASHKETKPIDKLQPHTHTYTSTITAEPTCTTDGETTYTCTACGDTYTEPIPATGTHADADNDGKCDACEEMMVGPGHCKYCGKIHGGAFGWLVKFFHSIFAIFKR